MRRFVQSFPFLLVMGVCSHAACGDSELGTSSAAVGPVGSQGAGYHPACNLDRRDGFCNGLGQNPETCECFDCVEAAMCTGKCSNDGACGADEDCTCIDCNGTGNCLPPDPESSSQQQQSSSPASSTADSSSSGPASSSMSSSSMASSSSGGQGGQGGM